MYAWLNFNWWESLSRGGGREGGQGFTCPEREEDIKNRDFSLFFFFFFGEESSHCTHSSWFFLSLVGTQVAKDRESWPVTGSPAVSPKAVRRKSSPIYDRVEWLCKTDEMAEDRWESFDFLRGKSCDGKSSQPSQEQPWRRQTWVFLETFLNVLVIIP